MSKPAEAHDLPVIVISILDDGRRPCNAVVADSPERLWAAVQGALRRQRSEREAGQAAVPLDFAAAMRQVEDEVYDAV